MPVKVYHTEDASEDTEGASAKGLSISVAIGSIGTNETVPLGLLDETVTVQLSVLP